jgi:hypothetical protein
VLVCWFAAVLLLCPSRLLLAAFRAFVGWTAPWYGVHDVLIVDVKLVPAEQQQLRKELH